MNVVILAVKELSTTVGVDCGANTVTKERGTVTPAGSI